VFRGIGAALIVALLALAAVGCGGGGGSSTSSSSPAGESASSTTTSSTSSEAPASSTSTSELTKAEFAKQANAICKLGSEQIHGEEKPFFNRNNIKSKATATKKQGEEFITEVVAGSLQAQAEGLSALDVAPAQKSELTALVNGIEQVVKAAEEDPSSILKEVPGGPLAEVNKVATAFDIAECTQP
jgi:hypothetical protein